MSGSARFDPEDTRAEPLRIREQAQGFARVGGQLTGRQDSLGFILRSLANSFSDVLHPLIRARIGEQFYTLQEIVGAMVYAQEITEGWADDVLAFQQRRADLIEDWESAQANGFWLTRAPGYANVEPEMRETLFDDARRRVLTQLNSDADANATTFLLAAQDRGRQFREGPTVANVLGLLDAGRSGIAGAAGLALLYPFLPVTGPRYGLPRDYWGLTADQVIALSESDPDLAALLISRVSEPSSTDPYESALATAVLVAQVELPDGRAYGVQSAARAAEVGAILSAIPAAELALLAALFPAFVGNLVGMPFAQRIAANRIRIADALHRARADRIGVAAEAERPQTGYEAAAARDRIAALETRIEQYDLLLAETTIDYGQLDGPPWPEHRGRRILFFDDSGDGSWAELVGTIDAATDDVGILVPGVGTDAADMYNQSDRATEFVAQAARDGNQLAMIVWAGGDFPDAFPSAANGRYAEDLAQPLVNAAVAVQQELAGQGADAPVTVIGHSYGGLAVALATTAGLPADRLVLVNSPGLGSDEVLERLGDYRVYAMAVPGDPTSDLGPLIYGPSPIGLDGVVQLDTGTYRDGTTITGIPGHSGVFEESSTAWENILAVLTGRPVQRD